MYKENSEKHTNMFQYNDVCYIKTVLTNIFLTENTSTAFYGKLLGSHFKYIIVLQRNMQCTERYKDVP